MKWREIKKKKKESKRGEKDEAGGVRGLRRS